MRKDCLSYCTLMACMRASTATPSQLRAHAGAAAMLRCAMHSVHVHGPDGCLRCSLSSASVLLMCMKYSIVSVIARADEL